MPRTPEEFFGQAVNLMREFRKLSQREFAAKLNERGMPVDASAVSRIEKGLRSVRLVEALTIAEVLETDLDFLIRGSRSPSQELQQMRRHIDNSLRRIQEPIRNLSLAFLELREYLENHTELLLELSDDRLGAPENVDDYFLWVKRRLSTWKISDEDYVETPSEKIADEFTDIISTLTRLLCGPARSENGDDIGLDQETS